MPDRMYWPVYSATVEGVACGHVHATVDRAERCAAAMMAKGQNPRAIIYQRNQDGSRLPRRELVPVAV